ncbi:hypothetical protein AB4379_18565 [Vibrio breoganii]
MMQNIESKFKIDKLSNYIFLILFVILVLMTAFNIFTLSSVEFYRQDAMYYVEDYGFKFMTEGRWLNLLTFYIYKEFPSWFLIFGYFSSAAIFFYLIAKDISGLKLNSAIFSLLCINAPPLYSLLLWPVALYSSYFMLLILYFYSKKVSQFEILLLSGIFSFGIISNLHFLTPLIFMGRLIEQSVKDNVRFIIYWVVTFVIGFMVANAFVYLVTLIKLDSPSFLSIETQRWRLLRPSEEGLDILYNIKYALSVMLSDIVDGKFYFLLIGVFINAKYIFKNKRSFNLLVWAFLIYICFYTSNVFHGIKINFRSVASAFIGLSLLHLISSSRANKLYLLCCIFFFICDNYMKMDWYSSQVNKVKSRFSSFQKDLSLGGDLAIVYWNPKFDKDFNFDLTDKPYGFLHLNHFRVAQTKPYLFEQGFDKVEFVEYDVNYTGEIKYERKGETVHIYMQ